MEEIRIVCSWGRNSYLSKYITFMEEIGIKAYRRKVVS